MPAIELLTKREVAKLLRVTPRTVDRMRERGELEAVRIGPKLLRFNADHIAAVMRGDQA